MNTNKKDETSQLIGYLGAILRDPISGFEGMAIDVTVLLTGCTQLDVQYIDNETPDGDKSKAIGFDHTRLELVKESIIAEESGLTKALRSKLHLLDCIGQRARNKVRPICEGFVVGICFHYDGSISIAINQPMPGDYKNRYVDLHLVDFLEDRTTLSNSLLPKDETEKSKDDPGGSMYDAPTMEDRKLV